MWSGKMAARWRGRDVALNAGNSDFAARNTHDELVPGRCDVGDVELDSQSCMDHSILAIFEDATAPSEDKSGAEEESATLLSALTEMLDSVEDVNGTLSPFDTLPDSKLLSQPECRDSAVECSLANRLRPRSKSPNAPLPVKKNGDRVDKSKTESKSPPRWCKQQNGTKAEAEVEVFTSTSLVNLVRLMHTYCLKLHVEEESAELKKNHALFSQEEVWKYERPTEESDEEINVVSDDEAAASETIRDEAGGGARGTLLKGVLLNGTSPRGKKRVSFGPVHVASFDPSVEKGRSEETSGSTPPPGGGDALQNAADPALQPRAQPPQSGCDRAEAPPRKGEAKARAKALSLQQYRQLRQKRQPLVEKQGNYTTRWPSVPEPPKELTPILCLQGHRQSSCAPKSAQSHPQTGSEQLHRPQTSPAPGPHASQDKTVAPRHHSAVKRPRVEPKVIPSPAKVTVLPESKGSPVKKRLSIDPPNPVLLPLPAPQTAEPPLNTALSESSGTSPHIQPPAPAPEPLSRDCPSQLQELQTRFTSLTPGGPRQPAALSPSTAAQSRASSEQRDPKTPPTHSPDTASQPSPPTAPASENEPEPPPSSPLQPGCKAQSAAGIEAADLTSLLEQFEETQAKEERVEPALSSTSHSSVKARGHSDLENTDPMGPEAPSALPQTLPVESLKPVSTSDTPGSSPRRQTSAGTDIPEPLGTEIILSTQRDLPARRKSLPTKAIQIIDPRPLPPKKTHSSISEPPAAFISPHIYLAISCDHDYCGGPVSHPPTDTPQSSRSNDVSKATDELEAAAPAEVSAPAAEGQKLPPPGEDHPTLSEDPGTRPETASPSADKVCVSASEEQAAPCTLPTPPPSPPIRGRDRLRYRRGSPRSDSSSRSSSSSSSSSSSASPSPKRHKRHLKRSESSSCSSSRSPPRRRRCPYSRSRCSRSRSWSHSSSPSRSRSRSPSPRICHRQRRDVFRGRESRRLRREHEIRIQKLKAIDERRVVYVGRICRSMTHHELRERFSQFGEVECVSLHFRERGDHYAFVTFYNMDDAFAAIDNGSKLRRPNELPFDLCFGGRRQFCNSDYADLDANKDADPTPPKSKFEDLDFDQLLKQAQKGLKS